MMKKISLRSAGLFISQNLKDPLVGAEIGVYQGGNAKKMLRALNIKKLYLIDPYVHYAEYKDDVLPDFLGHFRLAKHLLSEFKDKIVWIRKKSSDAVPDIPDNLDFVYIDGNHAYEYVKQDLENYWPKLRKGGVLSGHDYNIIYGYVGVKKAVDEFVEKNNLDLNLKANDWWVVK